MKKLIYLSLLIGLYAFAQNSHYPPSQGGGGGVTAVTASSPLSSSGGDTPNISFTGTLTPSQVSGGDDNTIALFGSTGVLTDDTTLTYSISSKQLGIGNITYYPSYTNQYGTIFGWIANSDAVNSESTPFVIGSTDTSTDSYTSDVYINTGSNITVGATKQTGPLGFITGLVSDSTSTAGTGPINFQTGSAAGSGSTGGIQFLTGDANSAGSGNFLFQTGDSTSGDSGFIRLKVGSSTATKGTIQFQDGSEGTSGYVWTSTDTSGSGSWMPSSGANTALSNLTSPTAINQDLIFNETGNAQILTADSSSGPTKNLNMLTGTGTGQVSGSFSIGSGNSDTQSTGVVEFSSGNVTTATSNLANGGSVSIFGGNTASTNASSQGGGINITAGSAPISTNSGSIAIYDGNNLAGINIGPNIGMNILDNAGIQGAQFFSTDRELDDASGTPAIQFLSNLVFLRSSPNLIQWQDGSQSCGSGCVLTETDTNGTGTWMSPSGGNAITALTGDVTATGPGSAAASLVATTNSTLTTLSALSLPYSQVTGGPLATPLESVSSTYTFSNSQNLGSHASFVGVNSDNDQTNQQVVFGSTDEGTAGNYPSNVLLLAGSALSTDNKAGGQINIVGGDCENTSGVCGGGPVNIYGGSNTGTSSGAGAQASLNGGTSVNGTGGSVHLNSGASTNGSAGNIFFTTAQGTGSAYGTILWQDGSQSCGSGCVLTEQDTSGTGTWVPSAGSVTNNFYSGYTINGASWTTSSTTFVDGTNSGGNTLTERQGNISVAAASSNIAGITFTPASSTSVYLVEAVIPVLTATGGVCNLSLTDGTTPIQQTALFNDTIISTTTLSGIYVPGTGSAVTVKIQQAGDGTHNCVIETSGSLVPSIEWTIIQIK